MNRRGVSLIELLIAIIIAGIAYIGLAVPFVTERSLWAMGRQQAEAQRDAEGALRAIARAIRQGGATTPLLGGSSYTLSVQIPSCGGAAVTFTGGPLAGGQLTMVDGCAAPPAAAVLIDGVRSRVTDLVFTRVAAKQVRVRIQVSHENLEDELLETEILVRNAT